MPSPIKSCWLSSFKMADTDDELESQTALAGIATALSIDSVSVDLTDYRGGRRHAALVAPTHPIRALWYATWAEVGQSWLKQCVAGARPM